MAATRIDITEWFKEGVGKGHTHMVVVCDIFDHEYFPAFYDNAEDARKRVSHPGSMERAMEVYYLKEPLEPQINQHRCFNYGPEETPTA